MDRIKRYERRFTLIELLTVVALISMLMAVGVPAFARMIRGSKVDESARNIKLALEQAQMRAAAERCYVAVIFPNGNNTDVPDKLRHYRLGGFRTAYVRKNGDSYEFARWVEGSDWSNAPDGAALVRVNTSNFSPTNGYVTGCSSSVTKLMGGSDLKKVIGVVSGIVDDQGNDKKIDNFAIIFNPYGGIEGGAKLYLLVSEALIDGTSVIYPTAQSPGDNSTANYRVLKVNNLTGRVEFE